MVWILHCLFWWFFQGIPRAEAGRSWLQSALGSNPGQTTGTWGPTLGMEDLQLQGRPNGRAQLKPRLEAAPQHLERTPACGKSGCKADSERPELTTWKSPVTNTVVGWLWAPEGEGEERMDLRLPPKRGERGWSQTDNPQANQRGALLLLFIQEAWGRQQCAMWFQATVFFFFFNSLILFLFYMYTHILFHILFHSYFSQDYWIWFPVLLHSGPCYLSTQYTYRVHLLLLSSQSIPLSPLFLVHLWGQFTPNPLHSGAAPWLKTVLNLRNSRRPNEGWVNRC